MPTKKCVGVGALEQRQYHSRTTKTPQQQCYCRMYTDTHSSSSGVAEREECWRNNTMYVYSIIYIIRACLPSRFGSRLEEE